jgi:mannose-6-phosphate isomerase-like protein (cupin superfamily)
LPVDPGGVCFSNAQTRRAQHEEEEMAAQTAPVTEIDLTEAEMERHIARWQKQKSTHAAFIDTKIPGHEREIWSIIGTGNLEDPNLPKPPIPAQDFTLAIVRAEPGKGAALHSHLTQEVFIPLTGRWEVFWGPEGKRSAVLEPYDVISLPVHLMRGFRNVGMDAALLLAVVGGKEPGKVGWPESVKQKARAAGVELDSEGLLHEVNATR